MWPSHDQMDSPALRTSVRWNLTLPWLNGLASTAYPAYGEIWPTTTKWTRQPCWPSVWWNLTNPLTDSYQILYTSLRRVYLLTRKICMPISSGDSSPYIHHVVHPFRPTMLFLCPRRLRTVSLQRWYYAFTCDCPGFCPVPGARCKPARWRTSAFQAKMEQSAGRASPLHTCCYGGIN